MFNFTGWEAFLLWLWYAGIPLTIAFGLGLLIGALVF